MKLRLGAALLALLHLTCGSVPLLAPPGSEMSLFANPGFIPAHGGVSRITAVVIEPAGTPVADGTIVFFQTTLGRIDDRARTTDGIAQVNLVSDSRSGVASVTAFSGGAAAAPPSTTTPPTTMSAPTTGLSATSYSGSVVLTSMEQNTATIDVHIGVNDFGDVGVRAEPQRIGNSRTTTVIATVIDVRGNPLANVPVYFKVVTPVGTETFDDPGPVFTNNNGEARSVLRTRRDTSGTVTVVAEVPTPEGFQQSADLVIPVF